MVIRYSFLWFEQRRKQREEGEKDRPCVVVLAVRRAGDQTIVAVAPVTHQAPQLGSRAVEVPAETKARLGLDDERSWIVTNELNEFVWPGPDVRPIGSGREVKFSYGLLPRTLFQRVRSAIVEHISEQALKVSHRTK